MFKGLMVELLWAIWTTLLVWVALFFRLKIQQGHSILVYTYNSRKVYTYYNTIKAILTPTMPCKEFILKNPTQV